MRPLAVLAMALLCALPLGAQGTARDTLIGNVIKIARDSTRCVIAPKKTADECVRARQRLDSLRTGVMCPRALSPTFPAGGWVCVTLPPPPTSTLPKARFSVTCSTTQAFLCSFDGSPSTALGGPRYAWRCDALPECAQTIARFDFTYPHEGPRMIALVVRDSLNRADSLTQFVDVPKPVITPSPPDTGFASVAIGFTSVTGVMYGRPQPSDCRYATSNRFGACPDTAFAIGDTTTACAWVTIYADSSARLGTPAVLVTRVAADSVRFAPIATSAATRCAAIMAREQLPASVPVVPVDWSLLRVVVRGISQIVVSAGYSPPP